jgi:hypothetical protein
MLTWLRRIVSCFCLVLCVLFAALWVRSYLTADSITTVDMRSGVEDLSSTFQVNKGTLFYQRVIHEDGKLRWLTPMPDNSPHDKHSVWMPAVLVGPPPKFKSILGVGWHTSTGRQGERYFQWLLPIWSLVLTTALLAIAIRPKPRSRFGLRDLFTLTTVAAVVMGPLAFWLRAIG